LKKYIESLQIFSKSPKDYKKIIENLKKIGYTGDYSIEFDVRKLSDFEGVFKSIAWLRKYLN
jgi:sugar phosphate isomerase/epimerase